MREVVRLKNTTAATINLAGWKVHDDGDELLLSGEIAAGATKEIVDAENQLPLPNRGEVVELVNPAGQVEHRVEYEREQVERGEFIVLR
jgi:hypothetical protein